MIQTKFQEIIGTKYPIIQAGMGPYATTKLCIAVAKEGGLGLISTIGMAGPDVNFIPEEDRKLDFGVGGSPKNVLKQTIRYVFESLEDYPEAKFGVNIPIAKIFTSVSRQFMRAVIEIFEELPDVKKQLRVVVTSAGDPLPWAIDAKEKGAKKSILEIKKEMPSIIWSHVCPNVRGSQRAERNRSYQYCSHHRGIGHDRCGSIYHSTGKRRYSFTRLFICIYFRENRKTF